MKKLFYISKNTTKPRIVKPAPLIIDYNKIDAVTLSGESTNILDGFSNIEMPSFIGTTIDTFFSYFTKSGCSYGAKQENFNKEIVASVKFSDFFTKYDRDFFIKTYCKYSNCDILNADSMFDYYLKYDEVKFNVENTICDNALMKTIFERYNNDPKIIADIIYTKITYDYTSYDEYNRLEKILEEKYHMSKEDSNLLLEQIDTTGICTYVAFANYVANEFKSNPTKFEEVFGFPLYIKNSNNKYDINTNELILDLYINLNNDTYYSLDGNHIFTTEPDRTYISAFNDDGTINTGIQTYLENNKLYTVLNSYLVDRGISLKQSGYETGEIFYYNIDSHRQKVQKYIKDGSLISVKNVIMENEDGNKIYVSFPHQAIITEHDDEGIYISSWGKKYKIDYDQLRNGLKLYKTLNGFEFLED